MHVAVACAVLAVCLGLVQGESAFAEVNDKIAWKGPKELAEVDFKSNTKPLAMLFTQPWCGACKALKQNMVGDSADVRDLEATSKDYLMVYVHDDDSYTQLVEGMQSKFPSLNKEDFEPDGSYIPRLIFADPDGTIRPDVQAERPTHHHFYPTAGVMTKAMKSFTASQAQKAENSRDATEL